MNVIVLTGEPLEKIWADYPFTLKNVCFTCIEGFEQFDDLVPGSSPDVFVFDLDQVSLGDRQIRDLKKKYPQVEILIVSSRSCHPELKESMGYHIFACLSKPLDRDEFGYCLKSIWEKSRPRT